jgi:hypothetical protein
MNLTKTCATDPNNNCPIAFEVCCEKIIEVESKIVIIESLTTDSKPYYDVYHKSGYMT